MSWLKNSGLTIQTRRRSVCEWKPSSVPRHSHKNCWSLNCRSQPYQKNQISFLGHNKTHFSNSLHPRIWGLLSISHINILLGVELWRTKELSGFIFMKQNYFFHWSMTSATIYNSFVTFFFKEMHNTTFDFPTQNEDVLTHMLWCWKIQYLWYFICYVQHLMRKWQFSEF